VRINANVAPATHGETVRELVGGGDASRRNQRFLLRQRPLTYVGASTPEGRASTLEVWVDGAKWGERPSLFGAGPGEQAYAVDTDDDGTASVVFGDGVEGARLPTAQANVRARYRKGIGAAGNVAAGKLTSLVVRPGGVNAATNPAAASGGEDPETLAQARAGAPLTVLTLGRAVSLLDYADFARSFAGIAKSEATWMPIGARRGVVVTVAGSGGATIDPGGKIGDRLLKALRDFGDQLLPVRLVSYRRVQFRVAIDIKVDPGFEEATVIDQVRAAMLGACAFDARDFGQGVSIDEVVAVAHGVRGVVAVDVNGLRRAGAGPTPPVEPRLAPAPAELSSAGVVSGAELLTIDPALLTIGKMS
jgi:predicted phage baseplate assembly protein